MTHEEREKQRVGQWRVLEVVRGRFENWLVKQSWAKRVHKIEFIPHAQTLEVYVFYKTDADVDDGKSNGVSESVTQKMLSELAESGYPVQASSDVRFTFDSHENILKNYKGSYFLRLR